MWIKTDEFAIENESEKGNFTEIYFDSEYDGGLNYLKAFKRDGCIKFKFFKDFETGRKHFNKLVNKLGATPVKFSADFC